MSLGSCGGLNGDADVTLFFIDISNNAIHFPSNFHRLKPGGIWINLKRTFNVLKTPEPDKIPCHWFHSRTGADVAYPALIGGHPHCSPALRRESAPAVRSDVDHASKRSSTACMPISQAWC